MWHGQLLSCCIPVSAWVRRSVTFTARTALIPGRPDERPNNGCEMQVTSTGALSTKLTLTSASRSAAKGIQAAIVARNLLQPTLEGPSGSSVCLDRQVRAGIAVHPVGGLLVAGDLDLNRSETIDGFRRNLAVGGEYWFGLWFAVRAGARVNLEDLGSRARPVGAFGFSLGISDGVYLDAQLSRGRDGVEQGWSIAGRVGF